MFLDANKPRPPIGWPLLPFPDEEGRLRFPSLAESVRQNVRVILSTRNGEQLLHPGYGAGLVEFIGEPDTLTTRRRIHDRVSESLGRWEPRLLLDRTDVNSTADHPGKLRVEIAYRLRRTGESQTLGVTLELEP